LQQLQIELAQNFSNYNDSSSESCQDSSFSEVGKMSKCYFLLTTLTVSPFPVFCLVIRHQRTENDSIELRVLVCKRTLSCITNNPQRKLKKGTLERERAGA